MNANAYTYNMNANAYTYNMNTNAEHIQHEHKPIQHGHK